MVYDFFMKTNERWTMKVYVDMDGVIADFDFAIQKMMPYSKQDWRHVHSNYIQEAFDEIRGSDFFFHVPVFASTNALLQSIVNVAGGYVILSKPLVGDEENSSYWKRRWIEAKLNIEPDDMIFTQDKSVYASGNVLIDDQELIVIDWEKNGGYGIQFDATKDKIGDVLVPLQCLFRKF